MEKFCQIENLRVQELGRGQVQHLNINVSIGEAVCLYGAPGTGKSLVLRALMGFCPSAEGKIELCGQNVNELDYDELMELRKRVGYSCIHAPPVSNLTVSQNIVVPLCMHGVSLADAEERAKMILEEFELSEHTHSRLSALTGQGIHLLSLARAFAMPVDFFVLAEPFRAMSWALIKLAEEAIKKRIEDHKSFLICTDNQKFMENAKCRLVEMP